MDRESSKNAERATITQEKSGLDIKGDRLGLVGLFLRIFDFSGVYVTVHQRF